MISCLFPRRMTNIYPILYYIVQYTSIGGIVYRYKARNMHLSLCFLYSGGLVDDFMPFPQEDDKHIYTPYSILYTIQYTNIGGIVYRSNT